MFAFVYHEDFNKYDLGIAHPLIGNKPRRVIDFFKEKRLLENVKVIKPKKASEQDLLRVHNPRYIERVKTLSHTGGMLAMDTPAPKGIYDIARLATGGTILAGQQLFKGMNCTVNPLAGFHHASKGFSSGFCFFNDVAIVIEYLRKRKGLERFLIVDLDVHHANGTQEIYYDDPSVLNLSFHQDGRTLYPGTGSLEKIGRDSGEGYTVNLPLPPGTGSTNYLMAFDELVPHLVEQFHPEIIIYQSGVDTHHSDPLANLQLVYQTYYELGKRMIGLSSQSCNRLLVLFGGGYNSDASVICYYDLLCGFLGRSDVIMEDEIPDDHQSHVKQLISDLKQYLRVRWDF